MMLFQRLAYTNTVIPPVGSMMIERHGIMLRHLGLESYKGHLSSLLPHKRIVEEDYCVSKNMAQILPFTLPKINYY